MKKVSFVLLLLILVLCVGCQGDSKKKLRDVTETEKNGFYTCDYEGITRKFVLYIPEGVKNAPLVVMLHGAGGGAERFATDTKMNETADQFKYAIVYAQGLTDPTDRTSNTCWNSGIKDEGNDDTGFLVALAEYLQETYGFRKDATFAAGFSNGAFMMYRLANDAPDTFRAVASVSGTMSGGAWKQRKDTSNVGILQIYGTNDAVVPQGEEDNGMYGDAPAIDGIMEYWKKANGLDKEKSIQLSERATQYCYSSDKTNTLVWYIEIKDGQHSWPTKDLTGVDTNAVILDFFSRQIK